MKIMTADHKIDLPQRLLWIATGLLILFLGRTIYGYCFIDGPDYFAHINFIRGKNFSDLLSQGLPHLFVHYILLQFSDLFSVSLEWVFCIFTVLTIIALAYVKYYFIKYIFPNLNQKQVWTALLISFYAGAIYIFGRQAPYIGVWSPIAYHNVTSTWLKPIALLTLITFYLYQKNNVINYGIITSILLALGCLVKPNFAIAFLPAYGLYWLLRDRRLLHFTLMTLPTAAVLAGQYYITYQGGVKTSSIIFSNMGPWKVYNPFVFRSIIQNLLGLLAICYFYRKQVFKSPFFVLIFVALVISLLQALYVAEQGPRFEGMNFVWGYVVMTEIAYLYLIGYYLENSPLLKKDLERKIINAIFIFHVLCGFVFIGKTAITLAPFSL